MYSSLYSRILPFLYPSLTWKIKTEEKIVHLTFDDGPNPEATPFVLDELKKFGAKATFFCVGKNLQQYPEITGRIISEGHQLGNHTFHHLNGWTTNDRLYQESIEQTRSLTGGSNLFRPPYGKIRKSQIRKIQARYRIIMWNVLSFDFDRNTSPEKCLQNVISQIGPGSIVVFHDSAKALNNLKYALAGTLKFLKEKEFRIELFN
ncbi:MAG: polysaccharide deacetylase family protein [Bacteroidia bacterium]|nr:polysaccharide deacetylase family protein [Bacteroidia bacterium]